MSSLKRRLIANFGATTFGRVVSLVIQIVTVPVMLEHWGARTYGEWILLSTIPSYLAMSDIGFGNVAGNEITMLVASGKRKEALGVFQSSNLLIGSIMLVMAVALGLGIWVLPIQKWLGHGALDPQAGREILTMLGAASLFALQENLLHGLFRCEGKTALGITAKNIVNLGAFLGVMITVILGGNPVSAALVTMVLNMIGTVGLWWLLRVQIPWLHFGTRHATMTDIRRLFWPAISFMSFPATTLMSLQGILLVVGHVFGPVGVVTFSTARTISRTVNQALQVVNISVWPEVSAAFGAGKLLLVRKLHRTSCQLSIIVCLGTTLIAAVFGNHIWKVWTVGKVPTDPVLLNLLLIQMLIGAFWFTSSVVPAATNNHQGIARVMLAAAALSLLLSYPLMNVNSLGLRGAAIALIIGDALTAPYVLHTSLVLVQESLSDFCKSLLEVPALPWRWRGQAR